LQNLIFGTHRSKRKRADAITGAILPTAKPDLDNFLKAALDACNGIVFADDAHITEISAKKIYGVSPKTVFTIQAFGFEKGP
jgi:Holliday junction resolvase RusA-like endonuclease